MEKPAWTITYSPSFGASMKLTAHTHRLTDGAVAVYFDQFEWDSKTH